SLTAKIIKANALTTEAKTVVREDPKGDLVAVAKQYGLTAEGVDQAIRAWGTKISDPYRLGLNALYQHDYAKAAGLLEQSLRKREETGSQHDVSESAWFLGQSLYKEGKYQESVTAFRRSLELQPDDWTTLNNLALSLTYAEDY